MKTKLYITFHYRSLAALAWKPYS